MNFLVKENAPEFIKKDVPRLKADPVARPHTRLINSNR